MPCRLLRRKNIAEALLLQRWLRPEACLVTTGGISSADERAYCERLDAAARANRWNLHMGVLQGNEAAKPGVAELLAASEVVLLTSIQEGFGLPYVEAAAAARPLIARSIPNISPDLHRFGFRFPQCYEEIMVAPELFDWNAEARRQMGLFRSWRRRLPGSLRRFVRPPAVVGAIDRPQPVPFSRLTLTAQLEVLAQPVERSWSACASLNPFLATWRKRAREQRLRMTPWPRTADKWLGGRAYAQRFEKLVSTPPMRTKSVDAGPSKQMAFLRERLGAKWLFPLLWDVRS
jgi:hypothetical protein